MTANDHVNKQQFSLYAGKYAIRTEPGRWNHIHAWTLTPDGQPDTSALERRVGWLNFDNGGTIGNVHVREGYRRQGIASAMLDHARSENSDLTFEHSDNLTGDGSAWAKARPL